MLSSKELVYEALAFHKVPRVPYSIGFTLHAREKLLANPEGKELFARVNPDTAVAGVLGGGFEETGKPGYYKDEFGVVWDRRNDPDIGIPAPVITPDNLSKYRWPDPQKEGRYDNLVEMAKHATDRFQVMAIGFSLFERGWTLRGLEDLLMDFVDNQDFVEELLDKILAVNIAVIQEGLKRCPNIDAVHFGDDFGSQRGLIMGAERWRKLLKPRLAKQYGVAKAAGKKVTIHSCGMVQEIFDDLVEIGVNCFNPFQPEVMDVYEMFRRYRGRLAFDGGISTQRLLPYGSVQEVEAEVDRLLAVGRNGGYIIGPAHATPGDAKVENMIAMLKKILNQR